MLPEKCKSVHLLFRVAIVVVEDCGCIVFLKTVSVFHFHSLLDYSVSAPLRRRRRREGRAEEERGELQRLGERKRERGGGGNVLMCFSFCGKWHRPT